MFRNIHRTITALSIIIACPLLSVAQPFTKQIYTVIDGLPDSYIFNMKADPYGFMWIGTPQGLSRFNGKEFVNYGYNEGLPDIRVDVIFCDRNNRLWIGTRKGMVLFTGKKFVEYPTSDSLPLTFVYDIIETSQQKIWALTNAGVYEFAGDHWRKVKLYPGYDDQPCRSIVETDSGQFINYGNWVVYKNTKGIYLQVLPVKSQLYFYNRFNQYQNKLYVSSLEGLYDISSAGSKKLLGELTPLSSLFVSYIDSKNRFWIASAEKGLWVTAPGGKAPFVQVYLNPRGGNLISSITEDGDGNIWLANLAGLIRITEAKFISFDNVYEPGSENYIRDIYYDPAGSLVLGNNSFRPPEFRNNTFIPKPFRNEKELSKQYKDFIVERHIKDGKGRLWIVTRDFRLMMQDENKLFDYSTKVCSANNEITDVVYDSIRGKLITCGKGLCIGDENGFSPFVFSNNLVIGDSIVRLYQGSNGILFFTTLLGNIYSVDQKGFCQLQLAEFNSMNWLCRFYEDNSGALWILYQGRGVRKYRWVNEKLVAEKIIINNNSQLADNIGYICFDVLNRVWAIVPDGLVVLAVNQALQNTYHVVAQFPIHQLGVTSFGEAKLLADSSGNVWFTTTKKLFRFDISSIRFQTFKPRLVLEDIKINLKETNWFEFPHTLSDLYQLPDSLELSYRQSSIGFYFKAALQNNSGEFRYSYHLKGLDTGWSPSSVGNYVSFVNLPAGKYSFAVKARNSVSEWSDPIFFHFTILPPFWERLWFRIIFIFAIAVFIIYIFRSRIKKIQEEASVQNQLRELELKALKAQMNPHFIYNALNSIQALVSDDKKNESIKYIGSFSRLLRQVLEYSDKNVITLEKELETLRLYIQLESLRLDMKLNYRETISDQVVIEYEKLPPLLLQPFIENALWHGLSRKEGDKQLELAIDIESEWLVCRITDNGVGLQKAAEWNSKNFRIGQSMATSITYKRLVQFNRTENPLPLEYKELSNELGIVTGTSVVLRIKRIVSS